MRHRFSARRMATGQLPSSKADWSCRSTPFLSRGRWPLMVVWLAGGSAFAEDAFAEDKLELAVKAV